MKNIKEKYDLEKQIDNLQAEIGKKYKFGNSIKGNSVPIKEVFARIDKAVQTNNTVSILGDTGIGKELVAKAVYYN